MCSHFDVKLWKNQRKNYRHLEATQFWHVRSNLILTCAAEKCFPIYTDMTRQLLRYPMKVWEYFNYGVLTTVAISFTPTSLIIPSIHVDLFTNQRLEPAIIVFKLC